MQHIYTSEQLNPTSSANENDEEETLTVALTECERIVETVLNSQLDGTEKNSKLRTTLEKLREIDKKLETITAFSNNEDSDEMSTATLHFLIVPAYLAYLAEEMTAADRSARATHLEFAKCNYRRFIQRMFFYRLTKVSAPWPEDDADDEKDHCNSNSTARQIAAVDRRAQKIELYRQRDELETAFERLRLQRQRGAGNSDQTAEREFVLTLLRLWACRAVAAYSSIEEELKILEYAQTRDATVEEPTSSTKKLQSFIIAKTEAQKTVFGLGYPSIPTVTVDEWYDSMMANRRGLTAAKPTIMEAGQSDGDNDKNADGDDIDEAKRETLRQAAIRQDEWRDTHRRGWGNMHNKG